MNFSSTYILDARRTPVGRLNGALAEVSAVDLGVCVSQAILENVPRDQVGGSIFGHVLQAGCGMNAARQIALRCELLQSTPAYTINVVCGSGLQAVALAAREIEDSARLMLCGGTESMSNAPYIDASARRGRKYGDASLLDSIAHDGLTDPLLKIAMGETAERLADKYQISREAQDEYAAQSQQRAAAAQGGFRREMVAVQAGKNLVETDEHPRADTTTEKLAKLRPAFRPEGSVTAGNSSGINDGAAALLLGNEQAAREVGLVPRARILGSRLVGCDPSEMGLGPVGAIRALCKGIGWKLEDVEAIEINEAFAAQTLACVRELMLRDERVNQRGGAIALGHPIGASGARVLTTLLHIMEDNDLRRGIASLCIGGGQGIAMAIER